MYWIASPCEKCKFGKSEFMFLPLIVPEFCFPEWLHSCDYTEYHRLIDFGYAEMLSRIIIEKNEAVHVWWLVFLVYVIECKENMAMMALVQKIWKHWYSCNVCAQWFLMYPCNGGLFSQLLGKGGEKKI